MGKPGKNMLKFKKKHLKSAIERMQKLKPKRDTFKRKQAVTTTSPSGRKKATARSTQEEAGRKSLKRKLRKLNVDELMEGGFMDNLSTENEGNLVEEDVSSENDDMPSEDGKDYIDVTPIEFDEDDSDKGEDNNALLGQKNTLQSETEKHKKQLKRLEEKDPEFFKFLKDHDKELLQFSDEDSDGYEQDKESDKEVSLKPSQLLKSDSKGMKESQKQVLTAAVVDTWCQAILEKQSLGALRSLLRAFRTACHYGDGDTDDSGSNLSVMTSNVFNKIMVFVLGQIDGVFRRLFSIPSSGGKRDTMLELQNTVSWKNFGSLVKSYLGNALHLLNQMTDNQMISFTIRRLRASVIFLAAFPALLRKYLKAAFHFWSSGEGGLSIVSFLFIRDMAVRLGSECLEACLKGIYKAFIPNCKFVNAAKLQYIQFLGNCVVEIYGVDLAGAYQHAFVFIRQLAMILRNALTVKTKEAFKKVYCWKFMNCLDLWVKVLCTYTGKDELQPLSYPLTQIIGGVARLVPTARYFPLRLQCTKMLNRLASATGTFIPVASLLLDMLEFKELNRPPTGGVGKAIDFSATLKVSKPMLKTRAFQEECVFAVLEQLAEHLTQWSYSVAFPELAFLPLVRLRCFNKNTNIDRFRRQVKRLIDQVECNVDYLGKKRAEISFSPKDYDPVSLFLQAERESCESPLSKYLISLRLRAEQRKANLQESSVHVGEEKSASLAKDISPSTDEDDHDPIKEGAKVFSKAWLPEKKLNKDVTSESMKAGKSPLYSAIDNEEDDVVETLELSSDEDDNDAAGNDSEEDLENDNLSPRKQEGKKRKTKARFTKASKSHTKTKQLDKKRKSQKKQKFSQP